jgi:putative endonuclease
MPETTWYTYMVRCCDNTLYTGITTNPEKRLAAHNTGKNGAKYTRARRPVQLVYLEECPSRSAAAKREYALKQLDLAAKLQLLRDKGLIQNTGQLP